MSRALWVTGDTLEVARQLPDACVDLIVTSPPFLALRSYLPADDPAKAHEIGQEATPGAFLDVLLDLVEEWRRILTPHGSLCVELGDTYSGSGGAGGDYDDGGLRDGQEPFTGSGSRSGWHRLGKRAEQVDNPHGTEYRKPGTVSDSGGAHGGAGWPLAKSLCLIPQLFAVALSYGRNPLTGRTIEPWRVRNVVRWCRPNPPVGALGDKFRPATSEMLIACTGNKRWFDLDAVRVPFATEHGDPNRDRGNRGKGRIGQSERDDGHANNPAGAPPLDFWVIPTHPYKGSHYATFPPALVVKPVEAMCPRQVCTVCGQPSTRITQAVHDVDEQRRRREVEMAKRDHRPDDRADKGAGPFLPTEVETLGWTDCGHNAWRPGRVLDPFGGSGTTLEVATGHGRDGIGIDLDRRNADMARERIGGLFFTELTAGELAAELATTKEKDA